jgi:hypothetical protein
MIRPLSLLCVSAVFLSLTSQVATAQTTVATINTYTKQIDRNVNPKQARLFGDMSGIEDQNSKWQEFKTARQRDGAGNGDNLNESAAVWTRQGKVVRADFTFTSPSGDWMHFITYHFRDDGSLAKLHAQLNTFYGNVSVVRVQYFNTAGAVIHSTKKFLDMKSQRTIKPQEFMDNPVTVFRSISELPFHTLL